MNFRLLRNVRSGLQLYKQPCREIHKSPKLSISQQNVKEIRIPVPWGHIAGKWWGDSSKQPILALHGWQDNAGTFDPLLELLPESFSVLAIDSPGHGFSSHMPEGLLYNIPNFIIMCRRIQNYFKWIEPLTILGHSQGAVGGFLFTALYPESVNALVMIDVVKPVRPGVKFMSQLDQEIDLIIKNMTRSAEENKKYSLKEIEERWVAGTRGSLTNNAVKILMKRGVRFDNELGKYSFTRDPRLKMVGLSHFSDDQCLVLASNIKCNLLVIRFTKGKFLDASLKHSPTYLSTLEKATKSFKLVTVEGTHYGHLNEPESVGPIITEFIEKNRWH